jgi:hypothetical protein
MGCLVASALFCFFIVFVLLREKDESVSPPVNVPVKVDVPLSPPVDVPIVEEIPPNVEDVSMYEQPLEQQGYDDSIVEEPYDNPYYQQQEGESDDEYKQRYDNFGA